MKYWYQNNLRFLQTVLREPDIINYDPKAVVAYMKEVNANTQVINGGGVIDFFKNPLPMNKMNQFMGDQDILKDICEEIHAVGMRVIVRVDLRGVEQERYEQHPDWFGRRADNLPTKSFVKWIIAPCYNSYYANEHGVELVRYLFDHYDFDGMWENAATFGMGPCYCDRCRDRYNKDTGKEFPVGTYTSDKVIPDDYMDPKFDEYRAWKSKCAYDHIQLLRNTVKSYGERLRLYAVKKE